MATRKQTTLSSRNRARRHTTSAQKQIREMAERIVRQFMLEKIILFGSHARGNAGLDSDVDLLIVMVVTGSKREKAVEVGVALHGIRVPEDMIVITPGEFECRKDTLDTIEWPTWHEGKVLYGREKNCQHH